MKKRLKYVVLPVTLVFFMQSLLWAQVQRIDSLKSVLLSAGKDSSRVNALNYLSSAISSVDPDSALVLANEAFALSKELGWPRGIASSCLRIAWCLMHLGDFPNALMYDQKALDIGKQIGNNKIISSAYNALGNVYKEQANYPKALENYLCALKINENTKNKLGISGNLVGIGSVYDDEGDYTKALEYYQRALALQTELGEKSNLATTLGNIGNAYTNMTDYPRALDYYSRALVLDKELGSKGGIARHLLNIGAAYTELAELEHDEKKKASFFSLAIEHCSGALKITKEMGNKYGTALTLGNLGTVYYLTKKYSEAEINLQKAMELSSQVGDLEGIRDWELKLSDVYLQTDRPKQALASYQHYIVLRDSINNDENIKKQTRLEMQYEFDKKEETAHAAQERKDVLAEADRKRQNIILWAISCFGVLVLGFAIFVFRSFLQKKKVNVEISRQKAIIEEKQKEILDSIYYARRIQSSLMPHEKQVHKHLRRLIKNN